MSDWKFRLRRYREREATRQAIIDGSVIIGLAIFLAGWAIRILIRGEHTWHRRGRAIVYSAFEQKILVGALLLGAIVFAGYGTFVIVKRQPFRRE